MLIHVVSWTSGVLDVGTLERLICIWVVSKYCDTMIWMPFLHDLNSVHKPIGPYFVDHYRGIYICIYIYIIYLYIYIIYIIYIYILSIYKYGGG